MSGWIDDNLGKTLAVSTKEKANLNRSPPITKVSITSLAEAHSRTWWKEVIRFLGSWWGEAATSNCIVTLGKESLGKKNVEPVDESPEAPADGEGEGDDGRLRVSLGLGGVQEKDLTLKTITSVGICTGNMEKISSVTTSQD